MKSCKITLVLAVIFLCSIFSTGAFASVSNDEVTSQKLKEADGTSGQNTNSGSGVKTGHIQNGAVTDAKITGPISGSKLEKPANVIVVAKSGGDFTTISAALAFLPDPNTTPVVIKVMPGVYNESIQMKSNVNLVGSGWESTKITSSADATVRGANSSSIENITVENSNSAYSAAAAILNDNAAMRINNVKVILDGYMIRGIESSGADAKVDITNSIITSTTNTYFDTWGIHVRLGSSVTISNCTIDIDSPDSNVGILSSADTNQVTLKNSTVRVKGGYLNYGVSNSGKATISNSRVETIGGASSIALWTIDNVDMSVSNSEIISNPGCAIYATTGTKIGGSLIQGSICYTGSGPKVVNSWDENFNPIPNQ